MIKKSIALCRRSRTMPLGATRRMGLLVVLILLGARVFVSAAPNEDFVFGVNDARRLGRNEPQPGSESEGPALPYSQILRDAEPPYENLFRDVRVGGRFEDKIGPADNLIQGTMFSGPRINVPLASRGFRPEDAELKLDRFYLDLSALSVSLLYSDNVDLKERNRKDGLIGIVRLTMAALLQISDAVRLGVRGGLTYLPFRGEVGVVGFGVDDPLIEFESTPLFQTQLTLDQHLGGWDVEIIDDLRVRHRRFGAGWSFDVFDGEVFDEEDRAGRYVFRPRAIPAPGGTGNRNARIGYSYIDGRNLVGASASRLLPTVTRLEFGGYHSDYWYNGTRDLRLPGSRDTVYAMLTSERESLRFKPFARFRASKNDIDEGWSEDARVGITGPVTENLNLLADVGYYWRTDSDHSAYLARLRLRHTFNPLTYHQLELHRNVTEPIEEIEDAVTYLLHHVFRDNLSGQFYGSLAKLHDPRSGRNSGEERRAAVRFNYHFAQYTSLRLSGAYVDFHFDDPEAIEFNEWIGRAEIFYRHTTSLESRLIYQYRNRDSTAVGGSYWENLVTLSLIKYF